MLNWQHIHIQQERFKDLEREAEQYRLLCNTQRAVKKRFRLAHLLRTWLLI
jgi:hypothetical protein